MKKKTKGSGGEGQMQDWKEEMSSWAGEDGVNEGRQGQSEARNREGRL